MSMAARIAQADSHGRRRMIKTFKLYWIREDSQGSFDMGTFATKGEAEAAIDAAKAELIGQCGEDYQKAEIKAGSWSIEECGEDEESNA
jgi:hypothetical protein